MSEIFNNIESQYAVSQPTAVKQAASAPAEAKQILVNDSISAASPATEEKSDTVELSTNKETKKGPVKSLKGFIANIKKFFASASEYTKGTVKGIASGAVAGSLIYTAGNIINYFKSVSANKAGTAVKKLPNKVLAVTAAVIAVAGNIWNASLNATERSSDIDHRWTGHQNNNG